MNHSNPFTIREETFESSRLHHKGTVFTTGNGYLSTRGSFEEGYPDQSNATLIHGVFDDIPIVFTELANAPDWTELEILVENERFSMVEGKILAYTRELDLRCGLLTRKLRWQSPTGKTADLCFERFASLDDQHLLALRASVTPVDFAGKVEFRTGLDGGVDTNGYLHWKWLAQQTDEGSAWLRLRTRKTEIELALGFRLSMQGSSDAKQVGWDVHNHPCLAVSGLADIGQTVFAQKIVILYTSRDLAEPVHAVRAKLSSLPSPTWETLLAAHQAAWAKEWEACDVIIEGDDDAQLALRFNIFQLLIAAPRHDERVNIGAKTLSGFGYRGHAFWDTEIFMLPFFTYTRPEIARNLLSYRWHVLDGARRKAKGNGYQGAQFPWESAATGDEVTPCWVPNFANPGQLVRIWTGDIEIHVSSDIAYAILQYWQSTGDDAFMIKRGAEVIIESARFWASRAEWNAPKSRYEFSDVIGPDEYHDHVDNNAYTNYFARWHLLKAIELVDWLRANAPVAAQELFIRLALKPEELERWAQVAARIYCPFDPKTGMIEQFEGYFQRKDVDLADFASRSDSMQVILGIEGASQTQVLKQPDVLMLFYLLPELFDKKTIHANYLYYTPRTDHTFGSSLGPTIQAIMACRMDDAEAAYEHFQRAAHADLYDVRGNAGDGVHGASAGGLWQAVVFGFAGLRFNSRGWTTHPNLPKGWKRVAFKFYYRGKIQEVTISS